MTDSQDRIASNETNIASNESRIATLENIVHDLRIAGSAVAAADPTDVARLKTALEYLLTKYFGSTAIAEIEEILRG